MIYLYTNITPNADHIHFIASESAYNTYLADYELTHYNIDNYRITDNSIKLPFGNSLTINNYKDVSYMRDSADGKYYYVDDAVVISGYVVFSLSVDLWGTWYPRATISNARILRCNRNIDNGIYDDIAVSGVRTSSRFHYTNNYHIDGTTQTNKLVMVLYIEVLYSDLSGTFKQSSTEAYAIDLNTLWTRWHSVSDSLSFASWLPRWLGSLSGRAIGAGTHHKDARLLSAYLVPADLIYADTAPTYTLEFSLNTTQAVGISAHPLKYGMHSWSDSIAINPQYKYYLGTYNNYIELKRRTQAYDIQCRCAAGIDKLTITISDGDNEYDITNQFQMPITTTDNTGAGVKMIERVLSTVGTVGGAIVGGPAGVGAAIGSLVNQGVGMLAARHGGWGHTVGGGDAMTTYTFMQNADGSVVVSPPIQLHTYNSMSDESKLARINGADFGEAMAINSVFGYTLLGIGTDISTYIQADANISDIPTNAREYIKSKLASGLRAIKL